MWAGVPSEPLCLHTQSLATAQELQRCAAKRDRPVRTWIGEALLVVVTGKEMAAARDNHKQARTIPLRLTRRSFVFQCFLNITMWAGVPSEPLCLHTQSLATAQELQRCAAKRDRPVRTWIGEALLVVVTGKEMAAARDNHKQARTIPLRLTRRSFVFQCFPPWRNECRGFQGKVESNNDAPKRH
eukprot:TRINITY_DN6040_c0_g1_i5.p3 TRINITY_DN6040_c0_g1~~TRINITY_DN6040_c0_g1_i5.p3  ORF type:complete len:185 (-),score=39.81 TRINITY_DN6040_c0_g1_i5:68-622(-)